MCRFECPPQSFEKEKIALITQFSNLDSIEKFSHLDICFKKIFSRATRSLTKKLGQNRHEINHNALAGGNSV